MRVWVGEIKNVIIFQHVDGPSFFANFLKICNDATGTAFWWRHDGVIELVKLKFFVTEWRLIDWKKLAEILKIISFEYCIDGFFFQFFVNWVNETIRLSTFLSVRLIFKIKNNKNVHRKIQEISSENFLKIIQIRIWKSK